MRIGLDIRPFNSIMRFRRQELNLTQAELGKQAGVTTEFISRVETLKMPIGDDTPKSKHHRARRLQLIRNKLNHIAQALELEFDYLFPQDYLESIQNELLPWRKLPITWVREVDISQLPLSTPGLILPSPEELIIDDNGTNDLSDTIQTLVSELSISESTIIRGRYGLDSDEVTMRVLADKHHISIERVRQLEAAALRKLRHPIRSQKLRDYLR